MPALRYYRAHPRAWWGWGWGWGWYPLYPYGPAPSADDGAAPRGRDEQDRVYTRLSLYGAGRGDGYVAGIDLDIEGRYTGFELDVNALASEQVTGSLHDSGSDPIGWGTAHVTWAILSERSFRLRVETGASMLSMPSSEATFDREWRGKTVVGPDVGLSGQTRPRRPRRDRGARPPDALPGEDRRHVPGAGDPPGPARRQRGLALDRRGRRRPRRAQGLVPRPAGRADARVLAVRGAERAPVLRLRALPVGASGAGRLGTNVEARPGRCCRGVEGR